ncbi:hypothetical protein EW026_g7654 [Hermanssonia centrifuga]|uniref:ATP-dependent DNA helicase n=1 Tax=Hermanssonia centrifuga TaxID=98765 RepID=A0A4S4K727_9APHY|nr:hypothetical protein EW026_g7654 [Hermanssonia centrifuga]
MLLKPWRNLQEDLKHADQTWLEAFTEFVASAPENVHRVISGVQYHHDCRTAARNDKHNEALPMDDSEGTRHEVDDTELGDGVLEPDVVITEDVVSRLQNAQISPGEMNHALHAIEIAKSAKVFSDIGSTWEVTKGLEAGNATGGDMAQFAEWKAQMHQDVVQQNREDNPPVTTGTNDADTGSVGQLHIPTAPAPPSVIAQHTVQAAGTLLAASPATLKDEQFRAFDIMRWHLNETLSGNDPPPLRMIIYGEGGTGKSKVIQTITEEFIRRGAKHTLVKAAYTGVAASLIDGKTTHTIAAITVKEKDGKTMSDDAKGKLQGLWKHKLYLILDEYSMIGKTHLVRMERNISIGKQGGDGHRPDATWGGINVILCGDLHQFPPVAQGHKEFLFHPSSTGDEGDSDSHIGRRLYEEFNVVVILKQQMRVTDAIWRDMLVHLRTGEVRRRHIKMLRKLVLNQGQSSATVDFSEAPWAGASLVTPRHAVRHLWNENAARKICAETARPLFISIAEDKITKGRNRAEQLTLPERYALECRSKTESRRQRKDLPRKIELAIGMRVLVTENLETDLDLTNGARGEIVDIVLHEQEPAVGTEGVFQLKYLPAYVLVKMDRTRASRLKGLEASVVPVEPASSTMQIKLTTRGGKTIRRTVHRRQFPITPAYAFTDYRSQGQTLPYVIVDIASPPTGTLSLFNLYVALSRSSGRQTIRLLRDFDDELFLQTHDGELTIEDERLEALNTTTRVWWEGMGGPARMITARE